MKLNIELQTNKTTLDFDLKENYTSIGNSEQIVDNILNPETEEEKNMPFEEKLLSISHDISNLKNIVLAVDKDFLADIGKTTLDDLPSKDLVQLILMLDQVKDRNCQFNFNEDHMMWKLQDLIDRSGFDYVQNFAFMFYENPYITCIPPVAVYDGTTSYFPKVLPNISSASQMFEKCANLTQGGGLDISTASHANRMFYGCSSLVWPAWNGDTDILIKIGYSKEESSKAKSLGFAGMFKGCSSIVYTPIQGGGGYNTNYADMFSGCSSLTTVLDTFQPALHKNEFPEDVSPSASFANMFAGCTSISTVPKNWDLSVGENFSYMFASSGRNTLKQVSLQCGKYGKNYENMFNGLHALEEVSLNIEKGSPRCNMNSMFKGSFNIKNIFGLEHSIPTNCETMFQYCHFIETLHIGDMSECNNYNNMFQMGSNKNTDWSNLRTLTIGTGTPMWKTVPDKETNIATINFSKCYFKYEDPLFAIAEACANYEKHQNPAKPWDIVILLPKEVLNHLGYGDGAYIYHFYINNASNKVIVRQI